MMWMLSSLRIDPLKHFPPSTGNKHNHKSVLGCLGKVPFVSQQIVTIYLGSILQQTTVCYGKRVHL